MKIVKKWCKRVPGGESRTIRLQFDDRSTERSNEVFDNLREVMTYPNNHVRKLYLYSFRPGMRPGTSLLGPVLESPNNELETLYLGVYNHAFEETDIVALCLGFASQSCKLTEIAMCYVEFAVTGCICMLDGLRAIRTLQHVELVEATKSLTTASYEAGRKLFMTRLSQWLGSPSNQVRSVTWQMNSFTHDDASILAEAIMNENCSLEMFNCEYTDGPENGAVSLFNALRHPNCRLRRLQGNFFGKQAATALAESLKHPNCRLESLSIGEHLGPTDSRVSVAIAQALECAPASRLTKLILRPQAADIFPAFIKSLLSPCNKLRDLALYDDGANIRQSTIDQFHRALRRSNVVRFQRFKFFTFREAFNQPFLQVLYTLLSVKCVPRLAQLSWLRLLPVQDMANVIAMTLGWPLDDLRAPDWATGRFTNDSSQRKT